MSIPEISPQELRAKLTSDADFTLLDVRETWEVDLARLEDPRLVVLPLSRLAHELTPALPEAIAANLEADVVVMCHQGVRSADVTGWLIQQGWKNVRSLRGGIAAYAMQVDPSVGWY